MPAGPGERFVGYGIIGLPFTLGDALAFRRFPASSIGPAYTAVWHRDPGGGWTIYTDCPPGLACPRYFATNGTRTRQAEIRVEWMGSQRLSISVPEHQVAWAMRLETTAATTALNALTALLPRAVLAAPAVLDRLGPLAGRLLQSGPLRLTGSTPAGQRFALLPRHTSAVTAAAAVIRGRDLGPLGPHHRPLQLADLVIPRRGLFILGEWHFHPQQ